MVWMSGGESRREPVPVERRSPYPSRSPRLTSGRRRDDKSGQWTLTRKLVLVILIFLVDVVCLAGDALLLRNEYCGW
jgi:hypothetical protein